MTECERIIENHVVERSFLNEETRNNFTIPVKMKKVWTVELDLLRVFSEICAHYNLKYWAAFGTLLGAVRHGGFIPWDDDMDIWMPRDDYDRLLSLNLSLEPPYFLQTTLNDRDYYCSFARLRNSNTTGILVSKNNQCNNGIYIDIYPLDGLHKNNVHQWMRSQFIHAQNVAAHAYMYNINPSPVTHMLHSLLRLPFVPYNPRKVYKMVNRTASTIRWNQADSVGVVAFTPYPQKRNTFNKKFFSETKWLPFENTKVPVPADYDSILTVIYGNYMEFPPAELRGAWHSFMFDPDIPYKEYCSEKCGVKYV